MILSEILRANDRDERLLESGKLEQRLSHNENPVSYAEYMEVIPHDFVYRIRASI